MDAAALCCAVAALCALLQVSVSEQTALDSDLLVLTVATEETDGFKRFMRSAKKYGLQVKVLGMGEEWQGGDVATYAGGGHKVNLLANGLKQYKDKDNLVLMFVDSYDLIFTDGPEVVLDRFHKFNARVVFSAEAFCWPDTNLRDHYPEVKSNEKRFLNSGGFIGYAPDLYKVITHKPIKHEDDDQLYYSNIFLNPELREKWNIKLDTRSDIFVNLNGALAENTLKFKGARSYMYNMKTGTSPLVVHGNGPIKPEFNRLANYLADGWTTTHGCLACNEDIFSLHEVKDGDMPTVTIAAFVEQHIPFLEEFLDTIAALHYPKEKIDLFIHNRMTLHNKHVKSFVEQWEKEYSSVRVVSHGEDVGEVMARTWAIDACIKRNCGYLLVLDGVTHLTNPDSLKLLMEQNRTVLSPMLLRPGRLWSNFWGAISKQGFYARSEDYVDIVEYNKVGVWNVPFATNALLIQGYKLPAVRDGYSKFTDMDPDMSFAHTLREKGVFIMVSNKYYYGHLVMPDDFDTTRINPEMWQIFNNPLDWEHRYIHPNWSQSLDEGSVIANPCPDVYWFPIVTERFTNELVQMMEDYGTWSTGGNSDPRLAGGYENVPTIDIHMNQVDYEREWLWFLKKYVSPLQQRVFTGYVHDPPHSIMNFVVRYKPDEQPLLKPHHDSSTFTINIALNRAGIDYQGGGCRFIRYNCSVTDTKQGWMLMHPGRLTHYHEGLRTTNGTRYIVISFIDP